MLNRSLILLLPVYSLLTACDAAESFFNAQRVNNLIERARQDRYTPPVNGKLTEAQVLMFIAVRQKEAQLARQAEQRIDKTSENLKNADDETIVGVIKGFSAMSDLARLATLDIQAAEMMNINTAEYEWVKTTLLEVALADQAATMHKAITTAQKDLLNHLRQLADNETNTAKRAFYRQQISEIESNRQPPPQTDIAGLKHNTVLYQKYKHRLRLFDTSSGTGDSDVEES